MCLKFNNLRTEWPRLRIKCNYERSWKKIQKIRDENNLLDSDLHGMGKNMQSRRLMREKHFPKEYFSKYFEMLNKR